jgi:hypothetical protein
LKFYNWFHTLFAIHTAFVHNIVAEFYVYICLLPLPFRHKYAYRTSMCMN